jgi:hypothetical protein
MSYAPPSDELPQEYRSYLSIDVPYLDESSESSARGDQICVPTVSTENLTPARSKVARQISRSRSMDRYRSEQRSRRSSARRASSGLNSSYTGPRRCASLRPSDLHHYSNSRGSTYRRESVISPHLEASPRVPSIRRGSVSPRRVPQVAASSKEARRKRIVCIVCGCFLVLVVASVMVVVVTLTHNSEVSYHNVTSKIYTFAEPPPPHRPFYGISPSNFLSNAFFY